MIRNFFDRSFFGALGWFMAGAGIVHLEMGNHLVGWLEIGIAMFAGLLSRGLDS